MEMIQNILVKPKICTSASWFVFLKSKNQVQTASMTH